MKGAIVFGAGVVAFLFGALAYDLKHPSEAEAGGGGIGLTCGTGTGGAVCTASPTLTGTLTAAGISAVTGVFSGAVTSSAGNSTFANTGSGAALAVSCSTANACGAVTATCTASNCSAVVATATTNGTAYPIKIQGDTTSPSFGFINMPPADTNPSSASGAIGDLFMFTGGILRVEVATTPLWADVSGYRSMRLGWTAHAGGGQASAPVICVEPGNWSSVTTVASAGDSVKLPASFIAGGLCHGKNLGANSMNLFPNSGDQLCFSGSACAAADAAVAIGTNVEFTCQARAANAAQWDCR